MFNAELEVAVSNLHAQMSQRAQVEARLRESELRYRRLVELSPEAVLVISYGRVLYINPAGARLFGGDVATLMSIPPADLVHPAERQRAEAHLKQLITEEEVSRDVEARLVRLDGTTIEAEITSAAVNFDGQPAAQLLIRDVGERRAIERMKDELLSIVSHELRTPLTGLRGSLGLLAGGVMGRVPPRAQHMLDVAIANADRLIRLLNDLLDMERLRAGRMSLQRRRHSASALVEQAASETRDLAERSGVRMHVGTVDGMVHVDGERVVQVLRNLLCNAIKFTPADGEVRLAATQNGESVRFTVADTGRGIPAHQLDTIFERFRQVDASDSRLEGGAGLGLAISRGIIEQHEGHLWAESTLGQGSTFYLELPCAA